MKTLIRVLLSILVLGSGGAARAQASDAGPYVVGAVGGSQLHYDCWFFADCNTAHATALKLGAGWRFGVLALEAWGSDFGRASIDAPPAGSLRVRSAGIDAAWYLHFTPGVQGLLRAGANDAWQARTNDGSKRTWEPSFGLGLLIDVAPRLAVELAWDFTQAEGNNTGTVAVNALTAGLRLRF